MTRVDLLAPSDGYLPAGMIVLAWCVRCGANLSDAAPTERCSRAPDSGPHEAYVGPPPEIRIGSSLHVADCPRACPLVGFDPPCICRHNYVYPASEGLFREGPT